MGVKCRQLKKMCIRDRQVEEYLKGEMAPVFFGSALNNFGVQELLDTFVEIRCV